MPDAQAAERIWTDGHNYWARPTHKDDKTEYIRDDRYKVAKAEIARLTRERDQALARAAAAAGDMRERAASVTVDLGPRYDGRPVHYHIPENVKSVILALPIPDDAQKALDKLLAKAFSEGLEAATDKVAHDYVCKAIMQIENPYHALLNDGGGDEN